MAKTAAALAVADEEHAFRAEGERAQGADVGTAAGQPGAWVGSAGEDGDGKAKASG